MKFSLFTLALVAGSALAAPYACQEGEYSKACIGRRDVEFVERYACPPGEINKACIGRRDSELEARYACQQGQYSKACIGKRDAIKAELERREEQLLERFVAACESGNGAPGCAELLARAYEPCISGPRSGPSCYRRRAYEPCISGPRSGPSCY